MKIETPRTEYEAWKPGLETELPREYLPLSTIFRSENVSTGIAKAHELSDYCGLPVHELVAFRADRLIVHELLIRVIVSLAVPDGRDYEDLGRNFREIAATILNRYIAPHREELAQVFEWVKSTASRMIERELAKAFADPTPVVEADERTGWRRLLGFGAPKQRPRTPMETAVERDRRIISEWQKKSATADTRLDEACAAGYSATMPCSPSSPSRWSAMTMAAKSSATRSFPTFKKRCRTRVSGHCRRTRSPLS
jgi:hypothetical protein